jgi:hypothetical protein
MGRGRGVAVLLLSAHAMQLIPSQTQTIRNETKRNGMGCMGSDICLRNVMVLVGLQGGGNGGGGG